MRNTRSKHQIFLSLSIITLVLFIGFGYYFWRFSDFRYNEKSIRLDRLSTIVESVRSLEKKSFEGVEYESGQVVLRDVGSRSLVYFNLRDREFPPTNASQDLWAVEKSEVASGSSLFNFLQDKTRYYACNKSSISEEYECQLYTDEPNTIYEYGEYLNSDKYDYGYRGNLFNLSFSSVKVLFESRSDLRQEAFDRISNLINAAQ